MRFSNKFVAGIILGAAATAAAVFFLQSDKGKEVLSDIKGAADDVADNLKSKNEKFRRGSKCVVEKRKAVCGRPREKSKKDCFKNIKPFFTE